MDPHQFKFIILAMVLTTTVIKLILEHINARHLESLKTVPEEFIDCIETDTFLKSTAYTKEKTRFGIRETAITTAITIPLIFCGPMGFFANYCNDLTSSNIANGILFFIGLFLIDFIVGLFFSYRFTFGIETKYNFTTQTVGLWIADKIKSLILGIVLFSIIGSVILLTIYHTDLWWLWAWIAVFSFGLLMGAIYPILIAPIFNKFEKLENDSLSHSIQELMNKCKINISATYKMDAGKRSRHSNAYFAGLGRTKRIVLYDTLIEQMTEEQILAVLAHEAGHWKLRHVWKMLIMNGATTFAMFYIASLFITSEIIYNAFEVAPGTLFCGLFLLSIIAQPAFFILSPLSLFISRRHEYQADRFGVEMMESQKPLQGAIKNLCTENLSNLNPHPLYVAFHYSHPSPIERIRAMDKIL